MCILLIFFFEKKNLASVHILNISAYNMDGFLIRILLF